jgi:hypothetical protein
MNSNEYVGFLKKSVSEVLAEARRLQAAMREAEAEFYLFLRWIETERADIWETGGASTFIGWITSNQLCEPVSYEKFIKGIVKVSSAPERQVEVARELGVEVVKALSSYKGDTVEPEKLTRLKTMACAFEEIHERKPGESTSRDWVQRIQPKLPKVVGQAGKLRQLEAENQQLRAENRDLKRRLKDAESELLKLRKPKKTRRSSPVAAE